MGTNVPLPSLRHQESRRPEWYSKGRRTHLCFEPILATADHTILRACDPQTGAHSQLNQSVFLLCHKARGSHYTTDSSRGAAKVSMRVSNTSVPYDLTTEREGRKEGRKERRKKITERVSSLRRAQNTSNPVSSDFCKRLVEVLPSTSFRFLPCQKHLQ